ncbi:unnamed protein product [Arabidopsis lyrata]|uniref:Uncharacterized protein n=1 Tax=Arabidopsis lyrata subsp. lyrata TaxID=81972 RepID=D7LYC0_ARALL|nr:uncharacterized protein LOC9307215 [Arabidopsis lyrata subsp. lyrata]EFH47404.1 hypothetical protein ARALYDRAFT_908428 [Arabidopsis lyrata subsp. lyrata]CAH8270118.1 unnamed protein product [Arabidopsis lyrata]|eukprot:XP_002871145.1 uncharacterized protein LOC9307215 [Arabidopsis lyrata subsp. lyrata]
MEAISQTCTKIITNSSSRTYKTSSSVTAIPQTKLSLKAKKERWVAAARCVASGSGYAAAMEPITPEEEEELTQRRGICGGEANRGVWELLECLEKEAIMGDDDGRDPTDYNRRAKIFDKSSKIFKNSKEQRDQSPVEYLEKEAIMGADDGRDPKDYNRRAKIFDKSSKIFKNIKEQRDQSSPE